MDRYVGENMGRLTQKDKRGNWGLKGLAWENLIIGTPITRNTWEKLYGALCKLLDYEETGLTPEEIEERTYCVMGTPCEMQSSSPDKWVPAEAPPETEDYILLSFDNFSLPMIGRYEGNREGGSYYLGDEAETCLRHDLYVNAWQPLPESYHRGGQDEE